MAQKFLTDIELTRGLKDSSGDLGNSGQVLSSTGSALNWINANSAASVVYQDGFTGNGSTTAFTLANSIDNENKTQVYIDGVYQHKDTYSLNGTTLTFSTAPPNSSDIEVISFSSVSSADDILYDTDFTSAGLMTTNGSGVYSITTNNSSNWNTAYTYSQVGHLPLAGGTLTGGLTGTTATFSASVIANGNSNSFGNTTVGALTASSISSSGSLSISGNTNSIGTTTFTNDVTISGGQLYLGAADTASGHVNAYEVMTFNIDTDNDDTNRYFAWYANGASGSGTELLKILETGVTTFSNNVSFSQTSTFGNNASITHYTNGYMYIRGGSNGLVVGDNTSATRALFSGSHFITWEINSSAAMHMNSSSNLGIGTTSPDVKLHVYNGDSGATTVGNASDELILENDTDCGLTIRSGTSSDGVISFADSGDHNIGQVYYSHGSNSMTFRTNDSTAVTIDNSQNVGIGTTSPAVDLHIASSTPKLRLEDTDGGYAEFAANNTDLVIKVDPDDAVGSSTIQWEIDGSEYMRLQQQGRLGIGTASPSHILHVVSAGNGEIKAERTSGAAILTQAQSALGRFGTTTNHSLQLMTNSNTGITINTSGSVGIGTTSPAQKLEVVNSGFAYVRTRSTSGSYTGFDIGQHSGGGIYLNNRDNTAMVFMTNNAERMNILAGGEINFYNKATINSPSGASSIGFIVKHSNSNKAAELIHGGSGDEGQLKLYDSNSETVRISGENNIDSFINSGDVGIGATNPVSKLEVRSNLNSTNFTGITVTNTEGGGSNLSRAGIAFKAYDWVQSAIWHGRNMSDGNQGALVLGTNPDTSDLTVGGVQPRMYIINNGNVGIGTASPSARLHVNGVVTANDSIQVQNDDSGFICRNTAGTVIGTIGAESSSTPNVGMFTVRNNGNNRIVLNSNGSSYFNGGNIGIGVTSPQGALHVYSGTSERFLITGDVHVQGSTDLNINGSSRRLSFTAGTGTVRTTTANNLYLQANSTTVLELKSNLVAEFSGDVGINEGSPAAKLQVSGDRDGNSEYVAILGEDGGANGAANSGNTTPVHKTLLTGYSIPYSGQTNARLTSVGFLEFDSTPGWTGNQRNWALTSGYDMGGTNGPKFAILMGDTQNVEPQLGTNGATGTGTGDGANTRVAAYWKNSGDMVLPEGGLFVKGTITGDTNNANNTVNYLRTITIPYTGSSGSFTFDIDPVAEFGTRVSGGRLHLAVSGWQTRMNAGYIVYRNDGGGNSKIGTGNVVYHRYIWSETGGSQAMVSVSLISSSTNVIRISFSGWHTNDHGFEARLTATS